MRRRVRLASLGGVINGDNVNDLQDALKHAQQYFDAECGCDTPRMRPTPPRRPLASLRKRTKGHGQ